MNAQPPRIAARNARNRQRDRALRDAITRGDLPAGRVGKRRLLIRRADLEAWVDSRIALGSQEGDDA